MESKSKLWYFEDFNLLETLSENDKQILSKRLSHQQVRKNQVIYFPEDAASAIFFLKLGKVKISKYSEDGKEIIIAILGPGEIFGELAMAGQEQREEFAEASEDAVMCYLNINDLQDIMEQNPKFNLQITKLIGVRLKKIQNRLEALCFKSAEDRIRDFIKELTSEHGRIIAGDQNEREVRLNLKHQDIAKLTATSRQTVTSVMNDLERQDVIKYDRRRILVKDFAAL